MQPPFTAMEAMWIANLKSKNSTRIKKSSSPNAQNLEITLTRIFNGLWTTLSLVAFFEPCFYIIRVELDLRCDLRPKACGGRLYQLPRFIESRCQQVKLLKISSVFCPWSCLQICSLWIHTCGYQWCIEPFKSCIWEPRWNRCIDRPQRPPPIKEHQCRTIWKGMYGCQSTCMALL